MSNFNDEFSKQRSAIVDNFRTREAQLREGGLGSGRYDHKSRIARKTHLKDVGMNKKIGITVDRANKIISGPKASPNFKTALGADRYKLAVSWIKHLTGTLDNLPLLAKRDRGGAGEIKPTAKFRMTSKKLGYVPNHRR